MFVRARYEPAAVAILTAAEPSDPISCPKVCISRMLALFDLPIHRRERLRLHRYLVLYLIALGGYTLIR